MYQHHHPYHPADTSTILNQQTPPVIIDVPTLQRNPLQQQQALHIDLMGEKAKRKQSLEKNRLAGKKSLLPCY
jgi:hypothetical protein